MIDTRRRSHRIAALGLPLLAAAALTAACGSSGGTPAGQGPTTGADPSVVGPTQGSPSTGHMPAKPTKATTISVKSGHLVDSSGRTIYMWEADSKNMSTCNGACASEWPPVPVGMSGTGLTKSELTVITRKDGSKQAAYNGFPLYYFAGDSKPGDANGQGSDGFGAKWWELSASGHPITSSGGSTGSPASGASSSSSSGNSGSGGGYGY